MLTLASEQTPSFCAPPPLLLLLNATDVECIYSFFPLSTFPLVEEKGLGGGGGCVLAPPPTARKSMDVIVPHLTETGRQVLKKHTQPG